MFQLFARPYSYLLRKICLNQQFQALAVAAAERPAESAGRRGGRCAKLVAGAAGRETTSFEAPWCPTGKNAFNRWFWRWFC